MKVLAVTNMYPTPLTPASGTFVEQQVKGLTARGVEMDVLLANRAAEGARVYVDIARRVNRRLEDGNHDLVHVMYGGIMAAQVTRAVCSRPVVVTFHGSDLLGEHLSGRVREWIAGLGVLASWRAARRASAVVVVSRRLRMALPRSVRESKINVIPCGIDLTRFKPLDRGACRRALGWAPHALHVLFPANGGDPVKRPALAQSAVDELNRRGVAAVLHHLRGVAPEDVPTWLNASDVLLMTSLHEGSPTVVKEALACAVPIVSVDVGDVRERIQGVEGCFISEADPGHLAANLEKVAAGPRRVAAGRQQMQDLSLETIAGRLVEVYDAVLARAPRQ